MKTIKLFLYSGIFFVALMAGESLLKDILLAYQNNSLKNNHTALKLLEKEAMKGNINASFLLATAYKTGKAGEINMPKALYWYKISANNGDGDAMLMLGWLHYKASSNLKSNLKKARYWFKRSAEQGVEEAIEMLEILEK